MKPGDELDKSVAKVMGTIPPSGSMFVVKPYSTRMDMAMEAFEWLEQNHPWGSRIQLALCREFYNKEPSVLIWEIGELSEVEAERSITGDSYPHAICLAILESVKESKVT